jgi:type 1 glutamine amidotransferase
MKLLFRSVWMLMLCCGMLSSGRAADKTVLFVIGEREYGTRESLPVFARTELEPRGFRCEFVHAKSDDRASRDCHEFPGLADALKRADLLFLSVRRRYPAREDLAAVRNWIRSGRPVVAIRTSSHAFGERPKGEGYQAPEGHAAWNTMDRDLLGVAYTGHYNARAGHDCVVRVHGKAADSPLMSGVTLPRRPLIRSHLYKSEVVDPSVQVLLRAAIAEEGADEPVAWTVTRAGQKTFYTSIGGPEDMKLKWFNRLLANAVGWALE